MTSCSVMSDVELTGSGGGIVVANFCQASTVNSTVSGNVAVGNPINSQGICGGVCAGGEFGPARVEIVNSTVTANSAAVGGGVATFVATPAGAGTETVFANTIVAGNTADVPGTESCFATLGGIQTSLGHNLEDSATCNFIGPGDQIGTNPLLGPLADNGGATLTHALGAGSPAIDAADDTVCLAPPVNGVD